MTGVVIGLSDLRSVQSGLSHARRSCRESDEDCAPLQGLTGALDGFNYEQMENLCIDDDEVPC